MKNARSRYASVAGIVLLIALSSVGQSSAATNPLNGPRGLALASNGNLYVANQSGNDIVVFNPNFALVSSKTITAGISNPSGVAFDSAGNLYVSNLGSQSVTQYSSTGAQNTAGTITQGINNPQAIAVDAMDNIYVDNNYADVSIYRANVYPASGDAVLVKTYTPPGPIFGMATHNQFFAWGGVTLATIQSIDQMLGAADPIGFLSDADEAVAVAFDRTGNLYTANANNTVILDNVGEGVSSVFVTLPFTPEGIVVDSARSRVYISNQQGNSIAVYSATGVLLKTIQ